MFKKTKGFSLIELIVVIAIMAILTGLLLPSLFHQIERARRSKDIRLIGNIAESVEVGIAEELIYDDLMLVTDSLPYSCYLCDIYDLSQLPEGRAGRVFGKGVVDTLPAKIEFGSKGVKGKNGYSDRCVKVVISDDFIVTVTLEGAKEEIKVSK